LHKKWKSGETESTGRKPPPKKKKSRKKKLLRRQINIASIATINSNIQLL